MHGKRIAYLTSEYPAVSHTFIRREVEALRARGVSIETISIRRPDANIRFAPRDQEAQRTTHYLLPIGVWTLARVHLAASVRHPWAYLATLRTALRHRVPGARALLWSLFHFVESIALAAKLAEMEIDHVHNHFANSGANVGLLASRYLGVEWSLTLHGTVDWDYPAGYLLPEKIRAASFVACVSQFGRAQACAISPRSQWHKLIVVRCGVDMTVLPPRRNDPQPAGPLRVVTVGRLSPEKGQHGLLQAFAELLSRGVEAKLRFVGDGPLRESLVHAITELNLKNDCVLAGQKTESEVLQELAEADLFVLSSFMEGLPVVLMEALAMQVPVIAPCVAGIPELVRHGETGLLFVAGDWEELASRMEQAARDPEHCRTMAERGRGLATWQFDVACAIEPLVRRFSFDAERHGE